MPDRRFDWESFLNKLVFCFGCGRFGRSSKGARLPSGWKLLYQPHGEGPAGLHVCSGKCADAVRDAMKDGAVTEPLEMGVAPMMDAEMRDHMIGSAMQDALVNQGRVGELIPEGKYTFECHRCQVTLDPEDRRLTESGWKSRGVHAYFGCSKCRAEYRSVATGIAGKVEYELMEEKSGETVPETAG